MVYTKTSFFFCLFFSCLAGAVWAGTEAPDQAAASPVRVQTLKVQERNISSRVEVVGTVQAVEQAVIAAKISGIIVEIPVVLGSMVNRGDLLVKINAEEISARVLQAQAQLDQARRNLKREEKLLKQQASTPETVKYMRDMLAVAQAGYREVASMLSYTTINAPFSGVITRKIANTGDLATPGNPLLHLENPDRLQVVTSVPETIALRISLGAPLTVRVPAADTTLEATVAEMSPVVDPRSRTSQVKINLSSSSGLRTGMFARVRIPGTESTTLMVPEQAVIPFGQLEKIFVVHEGKAQLRLVRTGMHGGGLVEILSGLQAGEEIVTENNLLLINGQPLTTD